MKKAQTNTTKIQGKESKKEFYILDLATNKKTYYNSKKELTNKHNKDDLINYIKNDYYNESDLKTYKAKNGIIKAYIINTISNDILCNRKTKKCCYVDNISSQLLDHLKKHNLNILNIGAIRQIYYFN